MRNLLASETKQNIRKEYLLRLAVVASALFSCSLIIGGVTLLPSFVLSKAQQHAVESQAAYLAELDESADVDASRIVSETHTKLELLESVQDVTGLSLHIEAIDVRLQEGVHITTFSYSGKKDGFSLMLEGRADTRDDLLRFEKELKQVEHFTFVKLPLSDLAEGRDISFSITIEGM